MRAVTFLQMDGISGSVSAQLRTVALGSSFADILGEHDQSCEQRLEIQRDGWLLTAVG